MKTKKGGKGKDEREEEEKEKKNIRLHLRSLFARAYLISTRRSSNRGAARQLKPERKERPPPDPTVIRFCRTSNKIHCPRTVILSTAQVLYLFHCFFLLSLS